LAGLNFDVDRLQTIDRVQGEKSRVGLRLERQCGKQEEKQPAVHGREDPLILSKTLQGAQRFER
jgi:hypothetical protein